MIFKVKPDFCRMAGRSFFITLFILFLILWSIGPLMAKTDIGKNAEIHALPEEVKELMATFERMDKAIQSKNLDVLMNSYSKNYSHFGADRNEMRKVWTRLFQDYKELLIGHTFNRIHIDRSKRMAYIVCTGLVFGINTRTGKKERIDGWVDEVHYLIHEEGEWKILGHDVESIEPGRFGAAFHPLF
ncbi:MAG: nuclear transport factor 2 family protein [Nitrospirae bacterium]|nr:nuclear transport factor 2 family protein [Nitrospirota bacterium]